MNTVKGNTTQNPSVNSLVKSFLSDDFLNWPARKWETRFNNVPAVNISENADLYGIDLAAPGMSKEDFNIEVNEDQLIISAESKSENEKKENFVRREFGFNKFRKSFILPENAIDKNSIKASYENGVLSLVLPKREEVKPQPAKKIEIS